MLWYEENNSKIAQSTRIRLARNLSGMSFPQNMDKDKKREVLNKIKDDILNGNSALEFSYYDMEKLPDIERLVLCEKHLISREMSQSDAGGVLVDKSQNMSIMLMEEDHIRLQIIKSGLCLDEAYSLANKVDDVISETVKYAFDEDFGYLTSCPTNTGTGMRASVMLHLPALVMTNKIESILHSASSMGITVRGFYGEGSKSIGSLYQFSNRVTLGADENEICDKLNAVVKQIIDKEQAVRDYLKSNNYEELSDRLWRSYGILRYARNISSEEAKNRLSDVKLGIDMGIIDDTGINPMKISVITEPGFVIQSAGKNLAPQARDKKRADIIRQLLNN